MIQLPSARRPHSLSGFAAAALAVCFTLGLASESFAEPHTAGTPALSSKPGAPYTIYLDFGGFNYTGGWAEHTPGLQPPFDGAAANGTFNAGQIERIKATWAITASFYSAFNINVTTVDPAAPGLTDAQRQTFYLGQPNFMHTIMTVPVPGGWSAAGGSSGIGSTVGTHNPANDPDTQHTNFILFDPGFSIVDLGNGTAHENGHALGLNHQSDYIVDTLINEYCSGETTASGFNTSPGSYTAVMGGENGQQRKTFRSGSSDTGLAGNFQNDIKKMLTISTAANATSLGRTGGVDLHLVDDGHGHTLAAAAGLPVNGDGTVNFILASGVITPNSESNPTPMGVGNYTKDWFKFILPSARTISLTAHDGAQYLTPGVADPGITLRSVLKIYDAGGGLIATATEDPSTLLKTYSGLLGAGTYYASVESYGGHHQVSLQNPDFESSDYFDMGSYFLTGQGFSSPPSSLARADIVTTTTGPTRFHPLANDAKTGTPLFITAVSDPSVTILADGRTLLIPAGLTGGFTYTVSDGTVSGTATVTIVTRDPLTTPKVWNGLLYGADGDIAGTLKLTLTKTSLTGNLRVGAKSLTLSFGKFTTTGNRSTTLGTLAVTKENSGQITANLTGGTVPCTGSLRPAKPTAVKEQLNVALAADEIAVAGGGYIVAKVTAAGAVNYVGKLPDGRAFSGSSTLADNDSFSVYTVLSKPIKTRTIKTTPVEIVAGEFIKADQPLTDLTGEVDWKLFQQPTGLYKDGLDTVLTGNGSLYAPHATLPSGAYSLTLDGAGMAKTTTATTAIAGKPTLTPVLKAWTVSATAGTFTFSVKDPARPSAAAGTGLYLPKSGTAWGFFPGLTAGGSVLLAP